MSEFMLGQRWVSHADTELGLGIVVESDGRRVTLHFPAVGEDRTYAMERAPLTRLELKPGDRLQRHDGSVFTVIAVNEREGVRSYRGESASGAIEVISEVELDPHIRLSSPRDRLLNNQLDKPIDFKLRYATLIHQAASAGGEVRGLLGARTSLLSHQLYIASEVGRRFAPRVLLADEVGLGKTIEAGLILSQQLLTERVQRILILVPDPLVHQWLVEMLRRFNLHFALFDHTRLAESDSPRPFDEEQLVLCAFGVFTDFEDAAEMALASQWDMVVVDEAHHLSSSNARERLLLGFVDALARRTPALLLLTATPEQAGIEGHFDRLRMLDPDRFPSFEAFLEEQRHYQRWNAVIDDLRLGKAVTNLPPGVDPDVEPQEQVRQVLDRFGTGRVLFRNTRASVPGFPTRQLQADALSLPAIYAECGNRLNPEQYHDESTWLLEDPRVHWLENQLRALRPAKVLVICAQAKTALALEQHLHLRAGIRCAAFHEGLTLVERDRAAAFFADEIGGAQALICSEIGSEGRNFQFAHHLICFDLPLNPDLLEQRIGRLDRIGQRETVRIHVPVLSDSAQASLFRWLDEGLRAFTHPCSVGHAVFEAFREELLPHLDNPLLSMDDLVGRTRRFREQLEAEMEAGRDRLLEINSHDPERGAAIIAAIREQEAPALIAAFAELLFDRIGVTQDYHSETCHVLRPSEMLITGQLPGLTDDGVTVTFDRNTALARDDVLFLTWEHPLMREAMAVVAASELGNAVLATLRHPDLKPGTVLLEAIYSVDCLAPNRLEVARFVEMAPLRFVVTPSFKNASQLDHETLNDLVETVALTTAANVIRQIKPLLQQQMAAAEQFASKALESRRTRARAELVDTLGAELQRLRYLRDVNPAVREDELAAMETRMAESEQALDVLQATLQGLRVIVAT